MLKKIAQLGRGKFNFLRIFYCVLGYKKNNSSQANFFAIGWRFILTIILASYACGLNPLDILQRSIKAFSANTEKINLYAFVNSSGEINDDYSKGWWNLEQGLGAPKVASGGSFFSFSDSNSAFYQGGNFSAVFSDFMFLKTDTSVVLPEGNVPSVANEIISTEEEATDNNLDNNEQEDDTAVILQNTGSSDEQIDTGELLIELNNNEDVPEEEKSVEQIEIIIVEEPAGEIETLENETEAGFESETATEPLVVPLPERTVEVVEPDLGLLSLLPAFKKGINYFKNIINGSVAQAQEFIVSNINFLNELGEFKSATINFSLAWQVGINNVESDRELPVEDSEDIVIEKTTDTEVLDNETESDSPEESIALETVEEPAEEDGLNEVMSEEEILEVEIIEQADSLLEAVEPVVTIEEKSVVEEVENETVSFLKNFINFAQAQTEEAKIVIWYSMDVASGTKVMDNANDAVIWRQLDTLNADQNSNILNQGYFSYNADFLENWDDINNLKIKLEGLVGEDVKFTAYLDGVWIEAIYEPGAQLDKIEKRNIFEEGLEMLSKQLVFKVNEAGEMRFSYKKSENKLWDNFEEMLGLATFWQDIDITARVVNSKDEELDLPLTMIFADDGEFIIKLPELPRSFEPGLYKIKFIVTDNSSGEIEVFEFEQDFSWGVIAINTNKSIYSLLEEAYLQMAVLDDNGHTICDAEIFLEIISPLGRVTNLSTEDDSITRNPLCGPDNVIISPDYYGYYGTAGAGIYQMKLIASTTNGIRELSDQFIVKNNVSFNVERIGPTRIYPMADYEMTLNIKANEDYIGSLNEYVPNDFEIVSQSLSVKNTTSEEYILYNELINTSSEAINFFSLDINGEQELTWDNIKLNIGDEIKINYVFDAPNVSPEFYLLGPLQLADAYSGKAVFVETRSWQIASDAVAISTSTNGTNVGWTDPGNAWDTPDDFYASRDIPKKNVNDSGNYLQTSTSTAIDLGGDISSVEIGIEGFVEETTVTTYLVPYFDGSTVGDIYSISGTLMGTSDDDVTDYVTITGDTNRPNNPTAWTWAEILNLDIRVYGSNSSNPADRFLYIDQIRIRVNYTANTAPNTTLVSAKQKKDNSGTVDITIEVDDADDDDLRAKIEYVAGASCDFSTPLDPTLDEANEAATSTHDGTGLDIDDDHEYQVGTSTGWITTASGANQAYFDWLSINDIDDYEGTYCLRITANDTDDDDPSPITTTVVVDNKAPSIPGDLSGATTTKSSMTLVYGATSTDINFREYIIYYATSSPVTENDFSFSSSSDSNLWDQDLNETATTTINGLEENTTYYFAIWAYDIYGHVSSSSVISATTNKTPTAIFNSATQRSDASGIVDISIDVDDLNNDISIAKLEYVLGESCDFSTPLNPTLDEIQSNIQTTHNIAVINNANDYQISNVYTPATNTVAFDWFGETDEDTANDIYCLRLTVNDGQDDQNILNTATLTLDNVNPTTPGPLSQDEISTSTIILSLGATTTETNFLYYKIYYKKGTSSVTEGGVGVTEHIDSNLSNILFNTATTTEIIDLDSNTDYVFNIWVYDQYGHKASATEFTIKTNSSLTNDSLTLTNPNTLNYLIADGSTEWNIRAVVSEENGWNTLDDVILRLADDKDYSTPFGDIEFAWNQNGENFSETGMDINSAITLSGNSTSTCAVNTCTLDFKVIFNDYFASSSIDYTAELYSTNDSSDLDMDTYIDFFQIKIIRLEQINYRWRHDDGGE